MTEEKLSIRKSELIFGGWHYMIVIADIVGFNVEKNKRIKEITEEVYERIKVAIMMEFEN